MKIDGRYLLMVLEELGCHYKELMGEFDDDTKLNVYYRGKLDTVLELCMFLEFDELRDKLNGG